jgi:hypothetical protein
VLLASALALLKAGTVVVIGAALAGFVVMLALRPRPALAPVATGRPVPELDTVR